MNITDPHWYTVGLDIIVDGMDEGNKGEWTRTIKDITKESLAEKPIKYMLLDSQRFLNIGYNMMAGHLTMKLLGVDATKLPLL